MFALGLASTLAALGIVSTYVGRAYGSIGSGLPIGASTHGQMIRMLAVGLCISHFNLSGFSMLRCYRWDRKLDGKHAAQTIEPACSAVMRTADVYSQRSAASRS